MSEQTLVVLVQLLVEVGAASRELSERNLRQQQQQQQVQAELQTETVRSVVTLAEDYLAVHREGRPPPTWFLRHRHVRRQQPADHHGQLQLSPPPITFCLQTDQVLLPNGSSNTTAGVLAVLAAWPPAR